MYPGGTLNYEPQDDGLAFSVSYIISLNLHTEADITLELVDPSPNTFRPHSSRPSLQLGIAHVPSQHGVLLHLLGNLLSPAGFDDLGQAEVQATYDCCSDKRSSNKARIETTGFDGYSQSLKWNVERPENGRSGW